MIRNSPFLTHFYIRRAQSAGGAQILIVGESKYRCLGEIFCSIYGWQKNNFLRYILEVHFIVQLRYNILKKGPFYSVL